MSDLLVAVLLTGALPAVVAVWADRQAQRHLLASRASGVEMA